MKLNYSEPDQYKWQTTKFELYSIVLRQEGERWAWSVWMDAVPCGSYGNNKAPVETIERAEEEALAFVLGDIAERVSKLKDCLRQLVEFFPG